MRLTQDLALDLSHRALRQRFSPQFDVRRLLIRAKAIGAQGSDLIGDRCIVDGNTVRYRAHCHRRLTPLFVWDSKDSDLDDARMVSNDVL
jgi:hypothetical protein